MKLLAIDPGTRIMGLALFDEPVLVNLEGRAYLIEP